MSEMPTSSSPPRIAIITCAVMEEELRHFADGLQHVIHIEVLEQGLHNEPEKLQRMLVEAVERVEHQTDAQAIVLGYGLCSKGIEGIGGRRCQLVVARAHDCITLLLGSAERYDRYVAEHPGTYWYSPGWNRCHTPPGKQRYDKLRAEYVEKYGEDNAEYLMQMEQGWFTEYSRATYVDLGVGATDEDLQYTRDCAAWLNWDFDRQHGDPGLMQRMLAGDWRDDEVLVVPPGSIVRMTGDRRIIEAVESKDQHERNTDEGNG